jgi:predicted transcriptional regulator
VRQRNTKYAKLLRWIDDLAVGEVFSVEDTKKEAGVSQKTCRRIFLTLHNTGLLERNKSHD